jgi:hypothetical protein
MRYIKMEQVTLEKIHEDLIEMREEIAQLRKLVKEDLELSKEGEHDLLIARETSDTEYGSQKDLEKEFLE